MRDWIAKIEIDTTKDKQHFVSCEHCAADTKHVVLASADYRGDATKWDYQWSDLYEIVQCMGCESLSFRKVSSNSEDTYQTGENEWSIEEKVEVYPNRVSGRKWLGNTHHLPADVKRIYDEAKLALSSPQPVLTGIGIRALIENVCKEKAAGGSNLEKKIDDLVTKGFLTQEGAEILHGLRFLGNDAAHEGTPHSEKTLSIAFDVVENLLTNVYILPAVAAAELKRRP